MKARYSNQPLHMERDKLLRATEKYRGFVYIHTYIHTQVLHTYINIHTVQTPIH